MSFVLVWAYDLYRIECFCNFIYINSQRRGLRDHPFKTKNPSVSLGLKTSLRFIQTNVPHRTNANLEESNHLGKGSFGSPPVSVD